MKSIIFKTIIFIVILIVSFFIVKYLLNKKDTNVKENLIIEDFQTTEGLTLDLSDLETVFGINGVDNNFFEYDTLYPSRNISSLRNFFLHPKEFIDVNNENDNDNCLTKYLSLYNLVVLEENTLDLGSSIIAGPTTADDISFNLTLEDGFYGNSTLTVPESVLGVKFENNMTNRTNTYFDLTFLSEILNSNIKPINLHKFKTADTSHEVNEFIDFGVKNIDTREVTYSNFYIKNVRYLLTDQDLDSIKESVNESVIDLRTANVNLNTFLIKSVSGNQSSDGNIKGLLAKLRNDIFGLGVRTGSVLDILGEGNFTPQITNCTVSGSDCVTVPGVTTSTCTNLTTCATVESVDTPTSGTTQASSTDITLKDKMYREYIIYNMELLYCKMAHSLEGNEEKANDLFKIDNSRELEIALRAVKDLVTDFDTTLDINNTNINLSHYFYLVIILLKLRTKIINDNFLSKFNCGYMTYLFYSFNRAETILGDYINNIGLTSKERGVLNSFFSSYEFEGLYKLLILSVKGECNIFYEDESDSSNIESGLSLERIINEKIVDFNHKYYFFFKRDNTREITEKCRKVKREDCTEANTRGMCSWQPTSLSDISKGECAASINLSEKCFYINDREKCNTNPNCSWNGNLCKPSDCTDGYNCFSNSSPANSLPHCRNISFEENNEIKQKCYDKERVMYISTPLQTTKHSNPDSFFKRSYNHLNNCENDIYNTTTNTFSNTAEDVCFENNNKSCNFLKKNTQSHNPSNFQTCVHDDLVDAGNFFSCGDIKEEEKCDSKTSNSLSCFWQDGKCYKRDAPLHWITPGSDDYGIEDMTDCNNFSSEFSCPVDRCIWHNDSCIRKEDHPYYAENSQASDTTATTASLIPLKKELVDCEAINNNSNSDRIEASIECNSFKCKWDLNNKICSAKVGNSCSLHKSKEECLDPRLNYDPIGQQNKCRWSDNMSVGYCDNIRTESECNMYDLCSFENGRCRSKFSENGFCTDTRMLQPCQLFDKNTCPTEVKVDNMGNKIPGSNHCRLNEDACVNNSNEAVENDYDSCHYNYLNTGNCDSSKCRLRDLYDSKRTGLNIKKCISKESMPCSMLTRDECLNEQIVDNNCRWDNENSKCLPNQNMESLKNIIVNVANVGNSEYRQIQGITNQFDNINFITNENKKHYMRDIEPTEGLVNKLELKGVGAFGNTQLIYTSSENVKKISEGDLIEIKSTSSSYNVSPDTELYTFKVKSVDIYEKIIEIETNNNDFNLISINTQNELTITNSNNNNFAGVRWIVKNPSLGLFGSFQHSQAMIDSMKINDFYNNFF